MLRVPPPDTFDALRTELFRAFKPVNYEAHLESRLRSRKQESNESFTDYFHDVLYLCSRLEPLMEERVKIQHLFRGLPPNTVRGIFRFIHPLSTTDDFFREAQLFLQGEEMASRQELSTVPRSPLFAFQEGSSAPPSAHEHNQPSSSRSFVTREDLESFEQRLLDRLAQTPSQSTQEHHAGFKGKEWKKDRSRDETRNKRSHDGRPICNGCGKIGHIQRFCFADKVKTEPNSNQQGKPPPKPDPGTSSSSPKN